MEQQRAINELEAKGVRSPAAALLRITQLEDHIRLMDQHRDTAIKELEAKGFPSPAAALLHITLLEGTMEEIKNKCFLRISEVEGQFDELNKTLQQTKDLLAEKTLAEDLLAEKIIAIRLITDSTVDRATLESVFHHPPPTADC